VAETKACSLINYFRDAAIQARFMHPWETDRKYISDGGQIIWAVDADVVTLYTDPEGMAAWKDERIGYGQVFGGDDQDLSTAIAIRLADYIFFKLSPEVPLLIIPPIEVEIRIIWLALIAKFGDKPPAREIQSGLIWETMRSLENAAVRSYPEEQEIINKILHLIHLETGPAAEFRKLQQILELGRIGSPELIKDHSEIRTKAIKEALEPFSRIQDIFEHSTLTRQWFDRLSKTTKAATATRSKLINLERDAAALARLAIWNSRLEKYNTRIIYLTGARNIFEAAWNFRYKNDKTFADLYLRHPRAFLSSPDVLNNVAIRPQEIYEPMYDPSQFEDWIRTFIANFEIQGDLFRTEDKFALAAHSQDIAKATAHQQPTLASDFHQKWQNYTRNIRTAYRAPPKIQERIASYFGEVPSGRITLETWERLRRGLDEQIRKMTDETWESCFKIATRTGFSFLFHEQVGRKIPARTVPPLYFTGWESTHHFIHQISRWHENEDFVAKVYEEGIQSIQREEPSGYAYYLAHSILFAGRGQWQIAAILASRAIAKTGTVNVSNPSLPNGREAYYLMAYCRRHTARNLGEVEEAHRLIDRAIVLFQDERKHPGYFEAIPERFEVEKLAFKMTRLMYFRFGQRKGVGENLPDTAVSVEWQSRAFALIDEFSDLLATIDDRVEKARHLPPSSDEMKQVEHIRFMMVLQELALRVCNNIIATWLSTQSEDRAAFYDERISKAVLRLGEHIRHSSDFEMSYIVEVVYLCASAILDADKHARREDARLARQKLEEYEIDRNVVFPYDKVRLLHFRKLVDSAMSAKWR